MPAEGCVSTDAVSSQASLVCNCEKAAHDGSIWGTGISSEFGSRAAKPLHERCGVSAVSDGLVCPQIHTDPHILETLAKPGRGNEDVAPPVRLNPARKLLAGCIVFCDSDSCAKLFADGWLNSSAKLRKPISRNHRPTRLARPTRPTSLSAKREAQSLVLHCSLQVAKLKAQRPQGVARRKVFRIGSAAFANFA